MSGTVAGGLRAAQKILARDPDFYAKIGAEGGRNGHTGGFACETECDGSCGVYEFTHNISSCAGHKGGMKSRRTKVIKESRS